MPAFATNLRAFASGVLLVAFAVGLGSGPVRADEALGLPLPPGASPLGSNRFRSPLGFEATVEWFERHFKKVGTKVRFEPLIDLPDVAAAHAAAPGTSSRWSGLNVSDYGGAVVVFVMERR